VSDFNDRPFVAGSVTGLRAFDVDSLGRLTGVVQRRVFAPGENNATCVGMSGAMQYLQRSMQRAIQQSLIHHTAFYDPTDPTVSGRATAAAELEDKHRIGGLNCGCGFYAYFDGGNDYAQEGRVAGIIEGYGTCTVGSRGFRAEKARLVALVLPGVAGNRLVRLGVWVWLWALLTLFNIAGIIQHTLDPSWWVLLSTFALGFSSFELRRSVRKRRTNNEPLALVARNYPDVPVYRSQRAALRRHPLTTPEPPQPITPATVEDFWTREAQ
jgi:hypothetical protein